MTMPKTRTLEITVEIIDTVPEKPYSRDSWPPGTEPRVVYHEEEGQLYLLETYSVTTIHEPKRFGFVEARPQLEGSAQYLLEALAVAVHNRRLGT